MKKHLNIFIAWLMLAVLLYNLGFTVLVFELSIKQNRNSIQKFLSKTEVNQLKIIKVANDSLIVRMENQEIIFQGKKYDVKKEKKINGITYFYCIHDAAEEKLEIALQKTSKINSTTPFRSQNGQVFDAAKHLIKEYFNKKLTFENIKSSECSFFFIYNDFFFSHIYLTVITPPPKDLFSS